MYKRFPVSRLKFQQSYSTSKMVTATKSTKTFKLNSGYEIPAIGLGTWQSAPNDAYKAVLAAIKAGYKHIDTAWVYGNEDEVGKAIKDSGVPREELFITTKLWNTKHTDVAAALDVSLKQLGLDYIDLYLIHWPIPFNPKGNDGTFPTVEKDGKTLPDIVYDDEDLLKTWKQLETIVKTSDKIKSIGVSNVTLKQLTDLLAKLEIKPLVNQVENHPFLPQHELVKTCVDNGVLVEAYSPLGSTGAPILSNDVIKSIADKYQVSPATVVISWQIWRGVIVLPKSVTEQRIIDNLNTIELSKEDGELINEISKSNHLRICDPAAFWLYDLFGSK